MRAIRALPTLLLSASLGLGGCDRASAQGSGPGPLPAGSAAPGVTPPSAAVAAPSAALAPPSAAPPSESAAAAPPAGPPSSPALPAPPRAPASRSSEPGDRIYAKARHVWIQAAPRPSKGWLGYLTLGGSVRLFEGSREKAKVYGPGCDAWYRVEPMGYVCLGDETTLDPADPAYVALREHAAQIDDPFPYQYAESIGAPRYVGLPTEAERKKREWDWEPHQARLALAREGKLAEAQSRVRALYEGVDLSPGGAPAFPFVDRGPLVREARDYVAPGSTIAYSRAFDADERAWLYTSDHVLVPRDRTKPYPRSSFHGVTLGGGEQLPIAFFRKQDRPKLRREGDAFVETGAHFARLSHVGLTGAREGEGKAEMLETREPGVWVRRSDVALAEAREAIPFREGEQADGLRTWLDVSILGGTLVAYEGATPVFATMIAPGRGGLPVPGKDPISTASTPTGTFRVDGKFRTATMVSSTDSSIVHAEVQFVQNFHGAHALHGAYWHDAWGELKSGGCVNLSPLDAKWVFDWSEPRLPPDWHGVRSVKELGPVTRVLVRP